MPFCFTLNLTFGQFEQKLKLLISRKISFALGINFHGAPTLLWVNYYISLVLPQDRKVASQSPMFHFHLLLQLVSTIELMTKWLI